MAQNLLGVQLGFHLTVIFLFLFKGNITYFWMLANTLGISLGSHSTIFSLGDATQGLVPDLLCPLSLSPLHRQTHVETKDILLPQPPQLQGLPSYLSCYFLTHLNPAASPSAFFCGVIPDKEGLLFLFVVLTTCTWFLSSLHTSLTE